MPPFAEDFTKLEVYRAAMEVSLRVFELSETFPREEEFSLKRQLRHAASSIGALIAEAWGKRRYPRHFLVKLSDADAEQLETRHWLSVAVERGYVRSEEALRVIGQLDRIGRGLNVMMQKAESFRTQRGGRR
jgi:four helix bundle protein